MTVTQLADILSSAIAPAMPSYDPPSISFDRAQSEWQLLRSKINEIAIERGEWAGYPLPIDGLRLVLEPRFPLKSMNGARVGNRLHGDATAAPTGEYADWTHINSWYSFERNATIHVLKQPSGKSTWGMTGESSGKRLDYWMNTLHVAYSQAWDSRVERRAIEKLKALVAPQAFEYYEMVGGFLETSKRSGVTYLFRKLRPTITMRPDRDGTMRMLAVLCLHPLGYYEDSWAGVQCPTDDVICHLLMMRGDERRYWGKANHHRPQMASAGI